MASSTFRQIESGPTFEIYEGPICVMRMDWVHLPGAAGTAFRLAFDGHIAADCAQPIIRRYEQTLRANKGPFLVFFDGWLVTGYESGMRIAMVTWTQNHPGSHKEVQFLSQSKILTMGISVMSLALPGLIRAYSKRPEFDLLVKKAGLPLNPPMPAFSPSAAADVAR